MAKKILLNTKEILNCLQKIQSRNYKTVDTQDVYRFSQLMQEWWNPNGPLALLHTMNNLRVPYIRDGLVNIISNQCNSKSLEGKKILDIGCGGGILSEGLAKLGAEVTGIDASNELIALAQYHCSKNKDLANNRPTYVHTTIEEHTKTNYEKYDAVVASEVIEHVNEKELFVKSCVRATKPNGKLFFTTPSRTRLNNFYLIFFSESVLGTIPKHTHQYEKLMTPNELKLMLEMNDCLVESTRGFIFNQFSRNWKWTSHKLIMFAIQATKK